MTAARPRAIPRARRPGVSCRPLRFALSPRRRSPIVASVTSVVREPSGGDAETVELSSAPARRAPADPDRTAPPPGGRPWDDTVIGPQLPQIEVASPAPVHIDAPPVRLGRLELLARIGAGGMGEVYLARDLELDRQVAVKLVRPEVDSPEATARIFREAQMMARVTHPNVVRIYDVGRVDTRIYITMEYVPGTTLRAWLGQAPRTWRDIVDHYVRAGRGLAAAHRTGLVHRDFKPANVLVGDDDRVLVADFGLARSIVGEPDSSTLGPNAADLSHSSPSVQPVTAHGTVLGTPGYMSPEQLRAASVDARSDLFGFCVALYEALHGVRPFAGHGADTLLASIDAGQLSPPVARRRVPARITRALARGLEVDPARRFATMDDLLAVLERALRRPARALAAGIVTAAALLGAAALAGLGPFAATDPCAAADHERAGLWNEARSQAVRSSFAATGLDFAGVVWQRVDARLETYSRAWADARRDACEATAVRHEQSPQLLDLRMACLERRQRSLRALVDAWTPADRTTVERAVDSVATLPTIEPCSDPEWLTRSVRPPESSELAIAVARVRDQLARADALHATGRFREGLALATATLALSEALAHEPARAEALATRGRLLTEVGEIVDAEATLLAAVELAAANHHDELAADLWLSLMRLANRNLLDPGRGAAWIQRARAAQRRLGDPPARRILVLVEQGFLHYLERRYDDAERLYRTAIALQDAIGDDPHLRGKLAHNLAIALEASGKFAEARTTYLAAIAAREATFGPDHPEVARAVHDYGNFLAVIGELDEAGARMQTALASNLRTFGPVHHVVGRLHISLADLALRREAFAEAVEHAETAVAIYREVLPGDHRELVDAQGALGTARFFVGALDAALADFQAARELQRRVRPPDPIAMATMTSNIAETQVALARPREALASFAEVDRLLAEAPLRDLDLEARALTGRGQIALEAGDARRAVPLLEAAADLRRQLPDDPLALATLHEALARARAG